MGLREAKRYISELHKKQDDPNLWPDFLTGLPDKASSINKVKAAYASLGRLSISLIRIGNIHPYLIKYGTQRHAEIVQWTAAILRTTMDRRGGFLGTFDTHDFIAVLEANELEGFVSNASALFEKKVRSFYNQADLKSGTVISFDSGTRKVRMGLMNLVVCSISDRSSAAREEVIPSLQRCCSNRERNGSMSP